MYILYLNVLCVRKYCLKIYFNKLTISMTLFRLACMYALVSHSMLISFRSFFSSIAMSVDMCGLNLLVELVGERANGMLSFWAFLTWNMECLSCCTMLVHGLQLGRPMLSLGLPIGCLKENANTIRWTDAYCGRTRL